MNECTDHLSLVHKYEKFILFVQLLNPPTLTWSIIKQTEANYTCYGLLYTKSLTRAGIYFTLDHYEKTPFNDFQAPVHVPVCKIQLSEISK